MAELSAEGGGSFTSSGRINIPQGRWGEKKKGREDIILGSLQGKCVPVKRRKAQEIGGEES